jgi:hypothetical protein
MADSCFPSAPSLTTGRVTLIELLHRSQSACSTDQTIHPRPPANAPPGHNVDLPTSNKIVKLMCAYGAWCFGCSLPKSALPSTSSDESSLQASDSCSPVKFTSHPPPPRGPKSLSSASIVASTIAVSSHHDPTPKAHPVICVHRCRQRRKAPLPETVPHPPVPGTACAERPASLTPVPPPASMLTERNMGLHARRICTIGTVALKTLRFSIRLHNHARSVQISFHGCSP